MAYLKGGRCYLPDLMAELAKTKPAEKQKRIEIMKEYIGKGEDHARTLRGFVECLYHPSVVFDLPEGEPPYKKSSAPDMDYAGFSLFNFFHQKYTLYFAENPKKVQNQMKREALFIRTLESLHPKEAELLVAMKDKNDKKLKNFTESLCRDVFPNALPPKI